MTTKNTESTESVADSKKQKSRLSLFLNQTFQRSGNNSDTESEAEIFYEYEEEDVYDMMQDYGNHIFDPKKLPKSRFYRDLHQRYTPAQSINYNPVKMRPVRYRPIELENKT